MKRNEVVALAVKIFHDAERKNTVMEKYFCFSFQYAKGKIQRHIDVTSFCFHIDDISKERVIDRVFTYPLKHFALFKPMNSSAIMSYPEKFYRIDSDDELRSALASILPEEVNGVEEISFVIDDHILKKDDMYDFITSVREIKRKLKK